MKNLLRSLALLALPLLPLAPAASAAGVNPAIVAADAQWLVYVDLNALRESVVGKELIAMVEKMQLDTGHGNVGINGQKLSAVIGSATAYGTTFTPDPHQMDGALIVQGTADLRKIAESMLIQANLANPKEITELTDLPFPAYGIHAGKPPAPKEAKDGGSAPDAKPANPREPDVVIAFPPEPIVLVSKSKAQLLKARDVFRGAAPSLAKSGSSLAKFTKGAEGAYLFAASMMPGEKYLPPDGPQTRILRMANSGSLALGERNTDTFAHVELVASSDAMADKLLKIVQGMTAMMSLAETSDKQLAEFLNSANVARDGRVVTLNVAYSSTRLTQMIKTLQQDASRPKERSGPPPITSGKLIEQWTAEAAAPGTPLQVVAHTIERVELTNGAQISLGRASNGGKNVKFDRLEISSPAGGIPLVFKADAMRTGGPRGNLQQIQFPGADGAYTVKAWFQNDPDGKATYAVSVRNPPPTGAPVPPAAPARPAEPAPRSQ